MEKYLLEMFAISLISTLTIELLLARIAGVKRKGLLIIILVNVLTNPPAVLLCWFGCSQIPVEILVIIVETLILKQFSVDDGWSIAHPFALSLLLNGFSWLTGVMIQFI